MDNERSAYNRAVGQRIKAARKAAGLTQQQLADRLNLGWSVTIARWEAGTREPSLFEVSLLAEILNVSIVELLPQTEKF